MSHTSQATSGGDISAFDSSHLITPEHAFDLAAAHVDAPDQEWLVGLYLKSDGSIDIHQVFSSLTCRECPGDAFDALIDGALRCHATVILTVRKHKHPWRGPRAQNIRRFQAFCRRAEEHGIYVRDGFVADSTGEVYPILGEPVAARLGHFSPCVPALIGIFGLVRLLIISP